MSRPVLDFPADRSVVKWFEKLDGKAAGIVYKRLQLLKNEEILRRLQSTGELPSSNLQRLPLNPLGLRSPDLSDEPQLYFIALPFSTHSNKSIIFAIHEGKPFLLSVAEFSLDGSRHVQHSHYRVEDVAQAYKQFLADKKPTNEADKKPTKEIDPEDIAAPGGIERAGRAMEKLLEKGPRPFSRKSDFSPDV